MGILSQIKSRLQLQGANLKGNLQGADLDRPTFNDLEEAV